MSAADRLARLSNRTRTGMLIGGILAIGVTLAILAADHWPWMGGLGLYLLMHNPV